MNKDAQMRAAINQKLIETGERERLKELLRAKLIECGWKDQLKAHCKEVIKEKGLEHVTVDDLVAEITPKGRVISGSRNSAVKVKKITREYEDTFPELATTWQGAKHSMALPSHLLELFTAEYDLFG